MTAADLIKELEACANAEHAAHLQRFFKTDDSSILFHLSKEDSLWSQRMSVVACMYLIKKDDFRDFKQIAAGFLSHKHDLMHKAVGWMLREMGKRNQGELLDFLDKHAAVMPRTMLRYSLEKLSSEQRRYYMDM